MYSAREASVTSANINLTAGAASQLSITTQPSSLALAGTAFPQQPILRLRDADGNLVTKGGFVVSAAIYSGTGGGALGGTVTVTTSSNGTATFTNLKISKAGSYTLIFTSGALTPAISNTIVVQ